MASTSGATATASSTDSGPITWITCTSFTPGMARRSSAWAPAGSSSTSWSVRAFTSRFCSTSSSTVWSGVSRNASIPGGTSAAISAAFSFEIGPGPLGIGETSPTADAPASIAIQTSSIDFMQQTFTRVWAGGFTTARQSSLPLVQRICVFCGASPGARPAYRDATAHVARMLAAEGIGVVYGGGGVGLMGALADAVIAEGGELTGVIPRSLVDREIAHRDVMDMRVVGSMHERKALMAELSDAFIALPGGIGTLEELFEVYTWAQLGLHQKPCGLLNVEGYYDGIADFLAHAVAERFLREETRELLMIETDAATLIERLHTFEPQAAVPKWIDREET